MQTLNLFQTEKQVLKHLTNHGSIVCCIIHDEHMNVISQYPKNKIVSIGYCNAIIEDHVPYNNCDPIETLLVLKILAMVKLIT